eukprot:TRINITY_DN94865_c0_g1_i1.p1 TRINITY_DN94865_c0_g1~~TRINITY_DN94865_c0_g1_i1.p1  ORF type:complete len:406 (+),score=83.73 TRINITY_DN94865_c0_g1_i1:63-1280(+)
MADDNVSRSRSRTEGVSVHNTFLHCWGCDNSDEDEDSEGEQPELRRASSDVAPRTRRLLSQDSGSIEGSAASPPAASSSKSPKAELPSVLEDQMLQNGEATSPGSDSHQHRPKKMLMHMRTYDEFEASPSQRLGVPQAFVMQQSQPVQPMPVQPMQQMPMASVQASQQQVFVPMASQMPLSACGAVQPMQVGMPQQMQQVPMAFVTVAPPFVQGAPGPASHWQPVQTPSVQQQPVPQQQSTLLQLQPEARPPSRAPSPSSSPRPQPGSLTSHVGDDGFSVVRWHAPSRNLEMKQPKIISPEFNLMIDGKDVPFRLTVSATPTAGKESFQASGGRGKVSLKCQSSVAPSSSGIGFMLIIGSESRGPFFHDFEHQSNFFLGTSDWNLKAATVQDIKCFEVCLKVVSQ